MKNKNLALIAWTVFIAAASIIVSILYFANKKSHIETSSVYLQVSDGVISVSGNIGNITDSIVVSNPLSYPVIITSVSFEEQEPKFIEVKSDCLPDTGGISALKFRVLNPGESCTINVKAFGFSNATGERGVIEIFGGKDVTQPPTLLAAIRVIANEP